MKIQLVYRSAPWPNRGLSDSHRCRALIERSYKNIFSKYTKFRPSYFFFFFVNFTVKKTKMKKCIMPRGRGQCKLCPKVTFSGVSLNKLKLGAHHLEKWGNKSVKADLQFKQSSGRTKWLLLRL